MADHVPFDELPDAVEQAPATNEPTELFAPSVLDQIRALDSGGPVGEKKQPETIEIEAEDLEGLVEMPFDIGALLTRYEDFGLDEKESKRLAKLWLKPASRLLAKTKNADLVVALSATAAIFAEKMLFYRVYLDDKRKEQQLGISVGNSPRPKRQRENQHDETETERSVI